MKSNFLFFAPPFPRFLSFFLTHETKETKNIQNRRKAINYSSSISISRRTTVKSTSKRNQVIEKRTPTLFFPPLLSLQYIAVVVASHFSARITRVWEDDNAPVASRPIRLMYGYALRGNSTARVANRSTSNRVTILIDIPRLSLVHDQLPFLFLLIYLFSIKKNDRKSGRTFYRIVDTYLSRHIHRERRCFIISRCVK